LIIGRLFVKFAAWHGGRSSQRVFALAICAALIAAGRAPAYEATAKNGMVATGHALATEAGVEVLREGGNAVDAAVTAALTLGVVDGNNSGIGGGCLILIRSSDGRLTAIDGRETAPMAATKDMFVRDGQPILGASQTGPLAVGVPGALAAYELAVERCGSMRLARLLEPGIEKATDGFSIRGGLASTIASTAADLQKFPGSKAIFLHANGTPRRKGERLVQSDLASTYRKIASDGPSWFYRGPFAEKCGEWMAEHGGILTAADFAGYEPQLREPLETTYRGYTIIGFPPPSSGGIHVAQVLNILEAFDLREMERRDPTESTHVVAEAFKLAFADRAHWLGDSDFVRVPRGLIAKKYAGELAARIDRAKATPVPTHGAPPEWQQDVFGRHTTHIAAADAAGNWVAITATINTAFGSKVVVPGTGVVLNNEMDDFSIMPGVPNAFGLVGAENNCVAPGKRPLSSMSPTIVLDAERQPVLTIGAAGGPKIITQVILAIVRYLDFQQPLAEAVASPRFHHQWRPDSLVVERGLPPAVIAGLQHRGHAIEEIDPKSAGRTQAIAKERDQELTGVADPRGDGAAAGY
jgi:gamma-glutamyltranspeptidase/glutathione hydrolase